MRKIFEELELLKNANIISQQQLEDGRSFFELRYKNKSQFDLVHVLYYFGGLIAVSAMIWLMSLGWKSWGGAAISNLSLIYAVLFTIVGWSLWKKDLKIPSGLLMTLAVMMAPLFVFGVQRATGFWLPDETEHYRNFHDWLKSSCLLMATATLLVGSVYLFKIRIGILSLPLVAALWFLTMDAAPFVKEMISPSEFIFSGMYRDLRSWVSVVFGVGFIFWGYSIDRKTRNDFTFWFYFLGLLSFWGGLTRLETDSEFGKFLYFCIALFSIALSLFLRRAVFAVFGALGSLIYLSHLFDRVFKDSIWFPMILILMGLAVILIGVKIQQNKKQFADWLDRSLPPCIDRLRPQK